MCFGRVTARATIGLGLSIYIRPTCTPLQFCCGLCSPTGAESGRQLGQVCSEPSQMAPAPVQGYM